MTGDPDGRPETDAERSADAFAAVLDESAEADGVVIRPADPEATGDREALWRLKAAFERELGAGGESAAKETAYDAKLTDEYRERYLAWVKRCVASEPAVWLAVDRGDDAGDDGGEAVVGYAFVLPERLAMIWDGAVLNELYVAPDARGTGVADALLGAVVERARAQDPPMDRLLLDVAPTNDRARAFYERHGFEPWGEMVARDL